MTKYIDKSAVVAEIERRRDAALMRQRILETIGEETIVNEQVAFNLNKVLSFIDTLEVKKEMDAEANWVRRQRVFVKWREKNAYGAIMRQDAAAKFDEDVRQMVCFGCY